MSQRKYSLAEIDLMRDSVKVLMSAWTMSNFEQVAEDRLRTHMLNGTDPKELFEASEAYWEARSKRMAFP